MFWPKIPASGPITPKTCFSLVEQAARNNAVWCDAVYRAHGRPGQFTPDMWFNLHKAPPFYGNAVCLTATGVSGQIERIDELKRSSLSGPWGVKDSLLTLDLAPLGFSVRSERDRTRYIYYVHGRTQAGRYLVVVLLDLGRERALPVTARDMTPRERRKYGK